MIASQFTLYNMFYRRSLTRSQAWEPNRKHSRIVSIITVKRLMGTVKLSSFLPTQGRTDGSKSPRTRPELGHHGIRSVGVKIGPAAQSREHIRRGIEHHTLKAVE